MAPLKMLMYLNRITREEMAYSVSRCFFRGVEQTV